MDLSRTDIALPPWASRALGLLDEAGLEAWCVGGFVRDALLGRTGTDIDIATSAHWRRTQELFQAAGYKTFETGAEHGTITAVIDHQPVEITTFRVDSGFSDRRHPDSVLFVSSLREDLARRDFTVNAMAYRPDAGLFDPFGGQADLQRKVLKTVGDPRARFDEDALRVLRAVRFASQLGFSLEDETRQAMSDKKGLLAFLSAERIAHELEAFLCGEAVYDGLMGCTDIIGAVIPEIMAMQGFDQKTPYHIYDVLEHTAYVVQQTPGYPLVRWSALFHDIGKPSAFFTDASGQGHFYGHAEIGVGIAQDVMARLKLPKKLARDVLLLVRHHDDDIGTTSSAVRRFMHKTDMDPSLFRALVDLKLGDARSQAPRCKPQQDTAIELGKILEGILEGEEAFSVKDLEINGHDLVSLGVEPGPRIRLLLEQALEAVINGEVANEKGPLLALARTWARP